MIRVSPEALDRLREESAAIRDEAKHVQRRARLLTQQSAQLTSMVDAIVESEEDITEHGNSD
jgi:predicted  nucleic acid-binding Zn-ribbon protein